MQRLFTRPVVVFALLCALIGGIVAAIGDGHAPGAHAAVANRPAAQGDTNTPTVTATSSATGTGTATGTATTTGTATATPTPATPTATATATVPAATSTATATGAPSATATATVNAGAATADYFAEGYTGLASTNGRATFTEVINVLNPSSIPAPVVFTYYIQGQPAPQTVNKTIPAHAVLREPVNADVGNDKIVATAVTSTQRVYATRTITRVSPSGSRLDGSTTQPGTSAAVTWGFPEGYTGVTFQEYLTVLNPFTSTANVTVLLAPQASSAAGAKTLTFQVPAQGRVTENIRSLNQGNPAKSVGMIVTSDVPIVPERVLYFGDGAGSGKFGSTVRSGISTPVTNLRFAYGSSGGATGSGSTLNATGDQDFITLLNPNPTGSTAQVTATFYSGSGQQLGQPVSVTLAPGTRQTIIANTTLGSAPVSPFSVALSATAPIEAESAQYYGGSPNIGQHPGVDFPGVTGTATDAFLTDLSTQLADGTTVNQNLYLYNPGASAISINATYFGSTGATAQATYTVPAGGILLVNVETDTQNSIPPGPLAVELKLASGSTGGFGAYSVGLTNDNLSATEDVGINAY